jgi:hypothetical protein
MRCLQALFVFLVLAASAYLVLRLFSRLFGADVLEIMAWQIRRKQFLWIGGWAFLFLVGFFPLLTLLQKPFVTATMVMTHEGALLGYAANDEEAKLYDPVQKEYKTCRVHPVPRAARSFDETFETVAFYRPFLTAYTQNIDVQGFFVAVMMFIIAGLGFGILPLISYKMVEDYFQKTGRNPGLSLQTVLENCKAWTGWPLPVVVAAIVLFLVLSTIVCGYVMHRIRNGYEERFAATRQEFRNEIREHAAPGTVLQGRVINRMRDVETRTRPRNIGRTERLSTNRENVVIKHSVYTIEFRNLLRYDPVYLRLTLTGDAQSNASMKRLDALFPPDDGPESEGLLARYEPRNARDARELEFVVNDDRSVSLAPEKQGAW